MAKLHRAGAAALIGAFIWGAATGSAAAQGSVHQATLGEKNQKTAEVSCSIRARGPSMPPATLLVPGM